MIKLDMLNRHAYIHNYMHPYMRRHTQARRFSLFLCVSHTDTPQKSNEEEQDPQGLLLGRSVITSPAPLPLSLPFPLLVTALYHARVPWHKILGAPIESQMFPDHDQIAHSLTNRSLLPSHSIIGEEASLLPIMYRGLSL